jgi:hypothetical protein
MTSAGPPADPTSGWAPASEYPPDLPPPGPGVAPPFAAPPVDRSRRGLWIGLIGGGLALLLCCGGGLFGLGVMVVAGTNQAQEQAKDQVSAFITDVHNQEYQKAHDLLCSSLAQRTTAESIASEFGGNTISGYSIGQTRIGGSTVTVDATVNYADQAARQYEFSLVQEGQQLRICGWR